MAIAGGAAVSVVLQRTRSIGVEVPNSPVIEKILGDRDAPRLERPNQDVTLVVFTDYQCPACRGANGAMQRAIAADLRVGVIFKDWPIFGERSRNAARAAIAASFQGRYAAFHDALMRSPTLLDSDGIRAVAASVAIDWNKLQEDMREEQGRIEGILRQTAVDAFALGLRGTPGYLANRVLTEGALGEAEFERLFARARRADD
ncbi:DsbA family protein [Tardiphaga sp.]|uniref:DsbA family protein n=1 Tax=Tardiphaga sp. TaxID=1926292 RepID=UPI003529DD53